MHWRLLVHPPADGLTNMAVDEALLDSIAEGEAPPSLRLYRWHPPAVSFGYRQSPHRALDLDATARLGLDVVRRPTGGRALLHQHELTYSFTASGRAAPFAGLSVKSTYRMVTRALREALSSLGLRLDEEREDGETPPRAGAPAERPDLHLPCVSVPTGHEITVAGRKLVASAQRWRRRSFLQHGSIFLELERDRWRQVSRLRPGDPLLVVSMAELLPAPPPVAQLEQAIERGFQRLLGSAPIVSELGSQEAARVAELTSEHRARRRLEVGRNTSGRSVDRTEAVW